MAQSGPHHALVWSEPGLGLTELAGPGSDLSRLKAGHSSGLALLPIALAKAKHKLWPDLKALEGLSG